MDTSLIPPDFKDFLKLLNLRQVEYLLIGGYAVGYYGYVRATVDMDIWIAIHPGNAEKMVEVLREFGFAVAGLSAELFLKENNVATEIPEDLRDLMTKALGLRKHLSENKKDLHNKRQLQLVESKVRRLVKYYTGSKKLPKEFVYKPETAEILLSR